MTPRSGSARIAVQSGKKYDCFLRCVPNRGRQLSQLPFNRDGTTLSPWPDLHTPVRPFSGRANHWPALIGYRELTGSAIRGEKRPNSAGAWRCFFFFSFCDLHKSPRGEGQRFKQACVQAEGGAGVEIGVRRDCLWARVVWIKPSGGGRTTLGINLPDMSRGRAHGGIHSWWRAGAAIAAPDLNAPLEKEKSTHDPPLPVRPDAARISCQRITRFPAWPPDIQR